MKLTGKQIIEISESKNNLVKLCRKGWSEVVRIVSREWSDDEEYDSAMNIDVCNENEDEDDKWSLPYPVIYNDELYDGDDDEGGTFWFEEYTKKEKNNNEKAKKEALSKLSKKDKKVLGLI